MTFKEIINMWPSYLTLAQDLGVPPGTVAAWKHRNHLPARYWRKIVKAATIRGYQKITLSKLAEIAEI
jgi:hypothetical protein